MIPVDAIDPDQHHHDWLREYEWHLDCVPPIMDELIGMTLPHIHATQIDRPRVSGGGFIDNIDLARLTVTSDGRFADAGAAADATELWRRLVDYVGAVTAWINVDVHVPWAPTLPPTLTPTPDADPLTARALALTTIGWLIDHAPHISTIRELDDYQQGMFAIIRRVRGRYGITPKPRRPRARCTTCGLLAVVVAWADNPNGSAKPIRVARCQQCHQTWTEGEAA